MSQMAGEGARHFSSIVVIDFIMSDIDSSLADPSQEGKRAGDREALMRTRRIRDRYRRSENKLPSMPGDE
jgi:hypothetical protein